MTSRERVSKIDPNNFRHVLPKANEIVQVDLQQKRTVYPYKINHHKHSQSLMNTLQLQQYQPVIEKPKFLPPKPTVLAHFTKNQILYDKFNNNEDEMLFNANIFSVQKLKNLRNNDYVLTMEETKSFVKPDVLTFDSRFQSGNLSMASKVQDLYCLLLHNDVNTFGYTNWFYFSVRCAEKGNYKFAIMNYGKAGWPYNQGTGICTFVSGVKNSGWRRGGTNIQCQANKKIYSGGSNQFNNFNSLSFEYEFMENQEEVFFAYNIPYTYTELCTLLDQLQQQELPYFYRKLAGRTLVGNRLEMVTVTNFEVTKYSSQIPVIVLFARTHPGQTVSSWIMKYFLEFITSDCPKARLLRDNFVFKIFPMINPDGVIHGNYRCSLSGRDLNRRWTSPSKQLFPQIFYIKNQVLDMARNRPIKMIIDLHGHTQKKKVFMYGCNDKLNPHRCRLFPYMMSKVSKHFEFNFCNFSIDKCKASTARVNLYQTLKIPNVFTMETSQFGIFSGHLNKKILSQVGMGLGQALLLYFRPKQRTNFHMESLLKEFEEVGAKIQQQLSTNEELLKVGNEQDSGSERDPSVDNIAFDKLAKMNDRKDMRINSESVVKRKALKSLAKKQGPTQDPQLYKIKKTTQMKKAERVTRQIATSDGSRNHRQYKKANTSLNHFSKPATPLVSRRANVAKMINFSLSIEDQSSRINKIMTKIPVFQNIDWKFGIDSKPNSININKLIAFRNKASTSDQSMGNHL